MKRYSDIDPKCVAWMQQLVKDGHLPEAEVVVADITTEDSEFLRKYKQVHFFAGIGGWPLALQLAGWPEDLPIWTGSCPCQPFSAAGKRKGTDDDRHLWPHMLRHISVCRPPVIAGEQVASKLGREWLAGVRTDLEALGYEVGAADLCSPGVGAPHIRQRVFWVAVSSDLRHQRTRSTRDGGTGPSDCCGLGSPRSDGPQGIIEAGAESGAAQRARSAGGVEHAACYGRIEGGTEPDGRGSSCGRSTSWSNSVHIPCGDGKTRRIEPSISPLADGVPARVVRLRGYGNAIVPQLAAAFLRSFLEAVNIDPINQRTT